MMPTSLPWSTTTACETPWSAMRRPAADRLVAGARTGGGVRWQSCTPTTDAFLRPERAARPNHEHRTRGALDELVRQVPSQKRAMRSAADDEQVRREAGGFGNDRGTRPARRDQRSDLESRFPGHERDQVPGPANTLLSARPVQHLARPPGPEERSPTGLEHVEQREPCTVLPRQSHACCDCRCRAFIEVD